MMIPTIHTMTVLVTSQIDLASALIYLVTVTPVTLKVAIEKTPKMTKKRRSPFSPIYVKYAKGFSMNGIPALSITQASTPKLQGM